MARPTLTLRVRLKRLAHDMERAGFSQTEMGRRCGLKSGSTISMVLSGQRKSPKTLRKMAAALGYDVERYLVIDKDEL